MSYGINKKLQRNMIAELIEGDLEKDLYGGICISRLLCMPDAGNKEIERLNRVARWFELPHLKSPGRDLSGEPDFVANKLIRACYSLGEKLPQETLELIHKFFTERNFESKYKSENHMLLFHESRYLYALKYKDTYFKQYRMSAQEVLDEDRNFLQNYICFRAKRGWAEFDSTGYGYEVFSALLNLYDFAEEQVSRYAEMSANVILLDMIMDCSKRGYYGGAHGRVYEKEVMDFRKTYMYALCQLYFGEEEYCDNVCLEAAFSGFMPADYVYDVWNSRPDYWVNRECKHLHSITYDTPHRQVPQVPGSINKQTYVTPDYIIGGVTWQDDYPEGSEAAWYAHHEQHEWELSILPEPDIRIFTHHPGVNGPQGMEHGYWTGDLLCGCGQFFSEKNVAMATYDIPEKEDGYIHAKIPFHKVQTDKEGNYLWINYADKVFAALWFSEGIGKGGQGYENIEIRSYGYKHGVVCVAASKKECGGYTEFQEMVKRGNPKFDKDTMTLSYANMNMNKQKRLIDGELIKFPYNTYDSPLVFSKYGSGIIETPMAILNFSDWGSVTKREI